MEGTSRRAAGVRRRDCAAYEGYRLLYVPVPQPETRQPVQYSDRRVVSFDSDEVTLGPNAKAQLCDPVLRVIVPTCPLWMPGRCRPPLPSGGASATSALCLHVSLVFRAWHDNPQLCSGGDLLTHPSVHLWGWRATRRLPNLFCSSRQCGRPPTPRKKGEAAFGGPAVAQLPV
jgi:hypothetical protein